MLVFSAKCFWHGVVLKLFLSVIIIFVCTKSALLLRSITQSGEFKDLKIDSEFIRILEKKSFINVKYRD